MGVAEVVALVATSRLTCRGKRYRGRMGVGWGPGAGMASATVSIGPDPVKLARTKAAAQTVMERVMAASGG